MTAFSTSLPEHVNVIAPDGSEVRILLQAKGGSMAHFTLLPGQVSQAVKHRTVEELWYFIAGHGEFWHSLDNESTITPVHEGVCITIPTGAAFQFRNTGDTPLTAVAVTMPPWPGEDEAVLVEGIWEPALLKSYT